MVSQGMSPGRKRTYHMTVLLFRSVALKYRLHQQKDLKLPGNSGCRPALLVFWNGADLPYLRHGSASRQSRNACTLCILHDQFLFLALSVLQSQRIYGLWQRLPIFIPSPFTIVIRKHFIDTAYLSFSRAVCNRFISESFRKRIIRCA